jgi:dTDP-4-dehydrorhamnose reductase
VTQVNAVAPGILAEEAKRIGAPLIHYSSDFVYDGLLGRPYTEDDAPNPVNAYGKSKLAGERAIQAAGGTHLIFRTSWAYAARGNNFVLTILRLAREKPLLQVVSDQVGSPSWARSLAEATAELLRNRRTLESHTGIYHLSAAGNVSRFEFAKAIIHIMQEVSGLRDGWASVAPITSDQYPHTAKRPPSPVTSKDKYKRVFGVEMADWKTQLELFLRELVASSPQQSTKF